MGTERIHVLPQGVKILVGDHRREDRGQGRVLGQNWHCEQRIVEGVGKNDREKGDQKLFPASESTRQHSPEIVPRYSGQGKMERIGGE